MGEIVELVELELEWGWSPQAEAVVVVLARCVALLDCLFVCLFVCLSQTSSSFSLQLPLLYNIQFYNHHNYNNAR